MTQQQDLHSLEKTADSLAHQAEETSQLTLVTQFSSLKRTSKENQELLAETEKTSKFKEC